MVVSPLEIPGQILVRGYITNANEFPDRINRSIELLEGTLQHFGVKKLIPLQERIVFALESGFDLFVAGPNNAGKTTGYLILVVKYILEQLHRSNVTAEKRIGAPSAIIICESIAKGIHLKLLLQGIFNNIAGLTAQAKPKVAFVDNIYDESLQSLVQKPLDILVMTGAALQEFLNRQKTCSVDIFCFKYHRTRYIIFQEFGMKNYFLDKEAIVFLFEAIDKTSGQTFMQKVPDDMQIIFSGTTWQNDYIGSVRATLHRQIKRRSLMIFGSTIQALQYSKALEWKIDYVNGDKAKLNMLIGICKLRLNEERKIVVACNTSEQAITVSQYISQHGDICNKVITWEGQGGGTTMGVFANRMGLGHRVYVVADEAMKDIYFQDATCLIHFDIELHPNTRNVDEPFCQERFACMWINLEREWSGSIGQSGVTHLLVTGKESNFLAFYKFLSSANILLPQSLQDIAEQGLRKEFLSKPLCANLKSFAYCNSILNCPDRHEISQEDLGTTPDAPGNGELEFRVIKSFSPSLYIGKLLNHYVLNEDGDMICIKSFREEARERNIKMMDYYSVTRNRKSPLKISKGELFCVKMLPPPMRQGQNKSTCQTYSRAKITGFIYPDGFAENAPIKCRGFPEHVEVFCVDLGTTMIVSIADLLFLPKEFQQWKPHCVEIVLSGMLFSEETREYYSEALDAAKRFSEGKVWHAKVLMSLRGTAWVNPMVQYEIDPVTGHMKLGCNLLTEYVNGNYGNFQDNHRHMMMILEYIRRQDPNYPETEHEMNASLSVDFIKDFHKVGDPVQWNDIPLTSLEPHENKINPTLFKMQSLITPWEIYGIACESDDESTSPVKQLELELTREIEMSAIYKEKSFAKLSSLLEIGLVVAVQVEQERQWRRGLIMERIEVEDEVYNRLNVFLVDYGYIAYDLQELEKVVPIRKEYVETIPFQTIRLKLAHIKPINSSDEWQETEIAVFSSVVNTSNKATVVALSKIEGTNLPYNYYEAVAYQNFEEKNGGGYRLEDVGTQLVKRKCAEYTALIQKIEWLGRDIKEALVSSDSENSSNAAFPVDCEQGSDDSGASSLDRWNRFQDVEMDNGGYKAINRGQELTEERFDDRNGLLGNGVDTDVGNLFDTVRHRLADMGITEPEGGESVSENSEIGETAGISSNHENSLTTNGPKEEEFFDAVVGEEDHEDEESLFMDQAEVEMECCSPEEATALTRLCEWLMRTL